MKNETNPLQMGMRDGLLRQVAALEEEIGYSTPTLTTEPTTAWLRRWWRIRGRHCPHCGIVNQNVAGEEGG